MNKEQFRAFIDAQTWVFASTYAKYAPHEYVMRHKVRGTDDDFERAVRCIHRNGIRMLYYKTERQYLFFEGYFYWTIDDSELKKPIVINRCKPEDYDIVFMQKGTMAKKK